MRLAPLAAVLLLVLAGALALAIEGGLPGAGAPARAAAQPASSEPTPQTDDSVPAHNVTMIGATPLEAGAPGADETWGMGEEGEGGASPVLVRYTQQGGWSLGPGLQDASGQPLHGFKPDRPQSFGGGAPSPLAGQMTADGAGVLVGGIPREGGGVRQAVLARNPGGAFQETQPIPAEGEELKAGEVPLLKNGEALFGAKRAPLLAPLDEGGGKAGALLVPVTETGSVEDGVLHWDGERWARESIEIPAKSKEDFRVLAIGASSPANAWLLAQLSSKSSYPAGAEALFRRLPSKGGASWSWKPVALEAGAGDAEAHPLTVPVLPSGTAPFTVGNGGEPPTVQSQLLTVTSEGVWIDGERSDARASSTIFFKPEGEAGGRVSASWCKLPEGAPIGTPACQHELPEALPTGPSRSIAWANPATPFGERVITGLPDGVSLRLDGESFTRVLALGGGEAPADPGGAYGAAFSNPREGWLGAPSLPVHLTLNPVASRLTPWPVPFSHPLVAIAPAPGAPVGSLASEALAVGDLGQVARYKPGEGWLPESLFGAGERLQTPQLRAIAWPTLTRAYAVGDLGQMWLWRGETGLWERDPATPLNFRGNLLGVAFDPTNPARGYAVGSGGVLLRYGKTWTQETALPTQVQGASFTSIAFAGSEAIVVYRKLPNPQINHYEGGLLVNEGSGWQVDQGAATAMGSDVPTTVAGLTDGGAAVASEAGAGLTRVYEREGQGAPWQALATPLRTDPGSLELFREGGALRAIASGGPANGFGAESVTPAPPGFPPDLIGPYGPSGGGVLRQTPSGWSDEEHELNSESRTLPGHYKFEDKVYEPDPVYAVLVDPSGSQGWAVGGFGGAGEKGINTADVERYPADGVTPTGVGGSTVPVNSGEATFAIGGGAQCAAPCADLERARIGPDIWFSSALARAAQIAGTRAFLYTGPRVTTGETEGPATQPIPHARELGRYAQILASSPISSYAAATPTDRAGGSECLLEEAFSQFPQPFGKAGPALPGESASGEPCASGQSRYYAFDSTGSAGTVRVIVLDGSTDVGPTQLAWLATELSGAKSSAEPAIVIGNADLNAQIHAGDEAAAGVAQTLVAGGASAYFYDSPEENVTKPLQVGGKSILTFGSGTLGYVNSTNEAHEDFHGASGFLLAQVNATPAARETDNKAPVTVRLIPNIGELALEAKDGTLLRRSQTALFAALARRPRAGGNSQPPSGTPSQTGLYIPIPSNCLGPACQSGIFPEYTFSSSRPDFGGFVEENLASPNPHVTPLQNAKGEPVPDEPRNGKGELTPNGQFEENKRGEPINEKGEVVPRTQSGLFCAYNKGETTVTIKSGGLSSSLPVTVQAGSVRQPCGTVPLKELPKLQQQAVIPPPPPPAPAPAPAGPAPASAPPPVPLPPPPAVLPPAPARQAPRTPAPFFLPPALSAPVLAFVPPPVPTPARPTPPSGTSAVTSPVEMAEHEEEEESATESVSNQALAYRAPEHEPSPAYIFGIVLLAAFAGASLRRPRRGRREVRVAPATISSMRAQRRMDAERRR